MKKLKIIIVVSFLAIAFSSVSAYAFNNIDKKDKQNSNDIKVSLNLDSGNNSKSSKFNLCSSCAGCNGNCIINKK